MWSDLWIRARALFARRSVEAELEDELRFHFERAVEKHVMRGETRGEARRLARLEIGGLEQVKEECRDARGLNFFEMLAQDVRYGARMLRKSPGFTAIAVLTLALGIGANTTIFSVVNTVLIRRLPFKDPDRLVMVWQIPANNPEALNIISWPNFRDWQQQNHVFESMALFDSAGRGYNLSGGPEPEQVSGVRVSASYFPVLGVKPLLGRTFLPEEETPGKDREVVLSYGLWQRRYAADPNVPGRTIRIDGEDFTVVGVMPREFRFQFWGSPRQLWVPFTVTEGDEGRDSNSFVSLARLKPGVTLEQARAEMNLIGRRLAQAFPQENAGQSATVTPLAEFGLQSLRRVLLALLGVVGFVLLIACVNVANLMLARGAARQKEFAIRSALGAGRARIAGQMLTESLLLALLGGASGLLIASWGTTLLVHILPDDLKSAPFRPLGSLEMDGRVFAFTLAVTCLTGVLFGLAPAFGAFRNGLSDFLKESGRGATQGKSRLRQVLVASELALALVLLAGAGLMIASMARLLAVDPGLDPRNVLTMEMSLPQTNLYYGPPVHKRFCQDLEEKVGAVAGVLSVSAVAHLPLSGADAGRGFTIEGRPDPGPEHQSAAGYSVVCPDYLHTMGIPLIAGREFTRQDVRGAPGVILINEAMARRYWPNDEAVGKRIKMGYFNSDEPWLTVVGVFRDVRHWGLDGKVGPEFFAPYSQLAWPTMTVVARTASAPAAYTQPVKKALAEFEPDRPVSYVATMEDVLRDSVSGRRFPMLLLEAFALLALMLAAVGIAGVVSFSVAQRKREIGIRIALGARGSDVVRLILVRSMKWALAGVGIGVAAAVALTRALTGLLYQVRPGDPFVLGGVALLLTFVAALASYLPARRALQVDPIVVLHDE